MQKPEGSLAKWAGRSGTLRSGPSDPDLVARIKGGAVLISAVHPISGGQGGSGVWGRRGSPELLVPRRRVTGEGQSGALGVGLGRGLAVGQDGGTRNPLEWKARCGGVRSGVLGGGGGSVWRCFAGEQRTST